MTLLRLALTLVLAAFGWFVPPSAAGALADPAPIAIHTYYDDHHTESLMRTATERGPPARNHRTIYDLDGLQRLGHLARPRAATPRLAYTYDHQGPLVSPMGGSQPESRPPSCLTLGLASNHRSDNAANTATRVADDAFEHGYKYHPRIRERGLEDPRAHNFPYSFDDVILREKPITQADGSLLYRKPGDVNRRAGVYEVALNPDTGIIFHRTWRRTP